MLFPVVSGKQNLAFALIGSEKRLMFFFKQIEEREISFYLFKLEHSPSWESEKDVNGGRAKIWEVSELEGGGRKLLAEEFVCLPVKPERP